MMPPYLPLSRIAARLFSRDVAGIHRSRKMQLFVFESARGNVHEQRGEERGIEKQRDALESKKNQACRAEDGSFQRREGLLARCRPASLLRKREI